MAFFYLLAILPVAIGGVLWLKNHRVVWQEWLIGSCVAFFMAGMFHIIAVKGMTDDIETWSGSVTQVEHHPKWVEQYEEAHTESYPCGTDSNGNTEYCTRIYYTTEYDTHPEHWEARVNFGSYEENWDISFELYQAIRVKFGNKVELGDLQSFDHFGGIYYSGDRNTYVTRNYTGFICPVTTTKRFENRIKAAPSVFSFSKVPSNVVVYPWPNDGNAFNSTRVLGTANKAIHTLHWDQLNAVLGPMKQINLIIVGFDSHDSQLGHYQQAAWIGGKKNDLVITFGGEISKPSWVYTFGWTESELVKRNIDSYIIENGITTNLYSFLKDEIINNYKIKDWSKFDYITIKPSNKICIWYVIVMVIVQGGLWIFFHHNEIDKEGYGYGGLGRYGNYFRNSRFR